MYKKEEISFPLRYKEMMHSNCAPARLSSNSLSPNWAQEDATPSGAPPLLPTKTADAYLLPVATSATTPEAAVAATPKKRAGKENDNIQETKRGKKKDNQT